MQRRKEGIELKGKIDEVLKLKSEIENKRSKESKVIRDTGRYFEIKKKDGSIITVTSSEDISVNIRSTKNALKIRIDASKDIKSSEIAITGLAKTVYKYLDNNNEYQKLVADNEGKLIFNNDLSRSHNINLKLRPSTYILSESGWTPAGVGTWNPITRVATLTTEGNETIRIETSNVKLNGLQANNTKYKINGFGTLTEGIYIYQQDNITISNFEIDSTDNGIELDRCNNINISKCVISGCTDNGIYMVECSNIDITNNEFINNAEAIYLYQYNYYVNIENNIIINNLLDNNGEGISIEFSNNNSFCKIVSNTITQTNNFETFYGVYFSDSYNTLNLIKNNTITCLGNAISGSNTVSLFGIYLMENGEQEFNNILYNLINISNNIIQEYDGNLTVKIAGIYVGDLDSGNGKIDNNSVFIENNSISSKSNTNSSSVYGLWLNIKNSGGDTSNNNKVYIRNNNFQSTNPINLALAGIYYYLINNGCELNNNIIDISNNTTEGIVNNSVDSFICGVYVDANNNGLTIKSNKINIKYNSINGDSKYYGIYFNKDNNGCLISSNIIEITNNLPSNNIYIYAIYLEESNDNNTIIGNMLSNNQGTGIYSSDSNYQLTIQKNKIINNEEDGIYLLHSNEGIAVIENIIGNNDGSGLYIDNNSYGIYVANNKIYDNGDYGIYLGANNRSGKFICNSISDNSYGIYIEGSLNQNNSIISNTL